MLKRIKILIIVGARPNFIKVAPLFEEFKKHKKIEPILVHTGQHYDYEMSKVFFQELEIPKPNYNLNIGSGMHGEQTGRIMMAIEKVYIKENPDLVVAVGDVNSALAGALVATKLHIPVAHIEAGNRMFNMKMPEEINRVLVDRISNLNFCVTKSSVGNLAKEGIKRGVYFTGDTMLDAFLHLSASVKKNEKSLLKKYSLECKKYILLTLHRPANVDDSGKLKEILQAVIKAEENIIFPVHPRTKKQINKITNDLKNLKNFSNIKLIKPVAYTEMVILEKNAKKICTDSGGVQKEAYWLKIPCITLLESQGWPELHDDGWNLLVGTNFAKIRDGIKKFNPQKKQKKHFGDGDASRKIIRILKRYFMIYD